MIVATLSGALIGGIFGFVIGIACGILHIPIETVKVPFQMCTFILGLGVGYLFFIFQLKWFFKANFQDVRIAILRKTLGGVSP